MNSNYISAEQLRNGKVITWERDYDGNKHIKYHTPEYYFFIKDPNGEYQSTCKEPLRKLSFDNKNDFNAEVRQHSLTFESDFTPLERVLMDKYYGKEPPPLQYTMLDIEVDYQSALGWARPENPYAPINAITLYHQWKDEYITFAVPPPEWNESKDFLNKDDEILNLSNIIICTNEKELLELTLDAIQDSDILSGWNSDMFDMPYLVKRTEMVLGGAFTQLWSFMEAKRPWFKSVIKFGKENLSVNIYGRIHLDYLRMFKKFTFEGRPSFSLENIANDELDIPKLHYPGTLEELYHNDFELFIKYNIRDVEVMEKLDKKFRFLDLANELMHTNTVMAQSVLGSVAIIDSGIINHCHYELNMRVNNKPFKHGDPIEGAMVLNPKTGLWKWIGSIDIRSLYPSTYRALNISPEKLLGQFTNFEEDWEGVVNQDDNDHILEFDIGKPLTMKGKEFYKLFKDNNWSISAYGTVFDLNGQGFIPSLLENWYDNRVRLKGKMKEWKDKSVFLKDIGVEIGDLEL